MTHVQTIQLDELRPPMGPSDGGDRVEMFGSGFMMVDQVYFGTKSVEFDEEGDGKLIAYPPSGSGEVEVYCIDQNGNQSNTMMYRYLD